jgi:hypothetical protein
MAPIKFEDNIREKLQERELQPSDNAWNKLSERLGAPERKERSVTLWYAVAAGIAALLVVGSLVFNTSEIPSEELVLEATPSEKKEENIPSEIIKTPVITEELAVDTSPSEEKEKSVEQTLPQQEEAKKEVLLAKKSDLKPDPGKMIVENEVPETKEKTLQEKSRLNEASYINSKVEEVLAKVKVMQERNTAITAEDIDVLLAEAQREIKTQQLLNRNTTRVDAAALLSDVETELDRSFRDKVFDALGEGFQKIRTAMAERNN